MSAKYGLVLMACAGLALSACGQKQPTGQVVASIKGKEITTVDLRNEMNGFVAQNPQIRKAAEQQALNQIIVRKVIARAAEKAKIDKTPDFAQQQERLRETLLVRAWQADIAKQVPTPSREEAEKYIASNPDNYGQRKIFDVDQVRFPRITDAAVMAELGPVKTLPELTTVLENHKIPFRTNQDSIDALSIDPRAVAQIKNLPPGEVFLLPANNLMVANQIRAMRVVPFEGEPAVKQATAVIKTQRTQEAINRQFGSVLAAAKKDVLYNKAYEPPKPVAAAKPSVINPPGPAVAAGAK